MKVTAVVVAWNAADDLPKCLEGLERQDHDDLEIVVVDNDSRDGTADLLEWFRAQPRRHPLRVISNRENRGFCGGVNDALAASADDAVLLVNPDVVAAADVVRRCAEVLEEFPRCGSVQPRLHRPYQDRWGAPIIDTTGHELTRARTVRNRGEGEPDRGQFAVGDEVFGASGALVLHRRAMLDDVAWRRADGREPLTEDLFAYFDDVELDWRARLRGWEARYQPHAVGVHERGGAGPRRTVRVEALNFSNRLLVLATCDDRRSLARAAPLVVTVTALKTAELALTHPLGAIEGIRRLALLRACRQRRRQLIARATVPLGSIPRRWAREFRWRVWIVTWWRRTRGETPGAA